MSYFFSAPAADAQPYLYWSDTAFPPAPVTPQADITIYLPDIFLQHPTGTIPGDPLNPFQLTVHAPDRQNDNYFAYQIRVARSSAIWQFDNRAIRAFRSSYLDFLETLEPLLQPGALALVQQLLAQQLPLTYAETLYYHYGLDNTAGYVDLHPGMRLRAEHQVHQFIAPDAPGNLNGFVSSQVTNYEPCSYIDANGRIQMGFNPFLAALQASTVAPNSGGAGGLIDLGGAMHAHPYYRLFYPKMFLSSDSVGYSGTEHNSTLVGADSLPDLRAATDAYLRLGNCDTLPVDTTYFRGRTTFIPEIPVWMNGTATYVPLGTTIRQLLSNLGPIPRLANLVLDAYRTVKYYRQVATLTATDATGPITVRFPDFAQVFLPFSLGGGLTGGIGPAFYSPVRDGFDLPVLGGDYVILTFPT